jgi:inorganic pyrophosphatase
MDSSLVSKLPAFWERTQLVNVIIDTPKAAPFKIRFDEKIQIFQIHKAMPLGFVFPFNFGFVPSTRGGDGDALDVLILTDHVLPIGCVVLGELVAVLEATQIEGPQKQRNDRLIAIPIELVSRKPMLRRSSSTKISRRRSASFSSSTTSFRGECFGRCAIVLRPMPSLWCASTQSTTGRTVDDRAVVPFYQPTPNARTTAAVLPIKLSRSHIVPHSDISDTECPGDRFPFNGVLAELQPRRARARPS